MTSGSHSSYQSLQTSVTKNSARAGLGLQASYTYSKSIDDTSAVLGGLFGAAGTVLQTLPQDPWNPSAEKGPSTFDVTHVFSASVIQLLPLDRVGFLQPLGKPLTRGWQFLNITTLTTGSPFSVYSGIQQTGAGAGGSRPARPGFDAASFDEPRGRAMTTSDSGASNASFFNIPINVPGGTGPNHGRFGTLGRRYLSRPGISRFRFRADQGYALWPSRQCGVGDDWNFAPSYSIYSTSLILACRRILCAAAALELSARRRERHGRSSSR